MGEMTLSITSMLIVRDVIERIGSVLIFMDQVMIGLMIVERLNQY